VVARDSAGVRIIENARAAWADGVGWQVTPEPRIDIGGDESDSTQQLFRVGSVFRLDDGRIVVTNRGTSDIRWYGAGGRLMARAGGAGGGPGLFGLLAWAAPLAGDSVLAYDARHHMMSVFDQRGTFVRAWPLQRAERFGVPPLAPLADRTLVASSARPLDPGTRGHVRYSPLILLRYVPSPTAVADASVLRQSALDDPVALTDTMAVLGWIGSEGFWVDVQGGIVANFQIPFGRETRVAVGADRVFAGDGDRFEIVVVRPGRGTTDIYRVDRASRVVSAGDVTRFHNAARQRQGGPFGEVYERAIGAMPRHASMPAFGELRADRTGHLWVQRYSAAPGEPNVWTVLDPEGRLLGDVTLPQGLQVTDIGTDYVVGIWRDELDVEHVRLHALIRNRQALRSQGSADLRVAGSASYVEPDVVLPFHDGGPHERSSAGSDVAVGARGIRTKAASRDLSGSPAGPSREAPAESAGRSPYIRCERRETAVPLRGSGRAVLERAGMGKADGGGDVAGGQ